MLSRRATRLELIDQPVVDARLAERSHAFMRLVNRWLGGTRLVRRFIAEEARRTGGRLRVLDIGSGTCDIPLAVSRWARRRGLQAEFTCLEVNPEAAAIGRRRIEQAGDAAVTLLQRDVLHHRPQRPYDCAVGSMVFHHFTDEEILGLVEHLRGFVARSVLINDLRRSRPHYMGALPLGLFLDSAVRHDALLSIRRGFRASQLRRLLSRLDDASVTVANAWLFRVQAVIRFDQGSRP